MSLAGLLAIAGVLALATAVGAVIVAARIRGRGPARTSYMGPDVTRVEDLLVQRLQQERQAGGSSPLDQDDRLGEIARHHAFWMATAGRCQSLDDQGRDVRARRKFLHPDLAGELAERVGVVEIGTSDEGRCLEEIVRADLTGPLWSEEGWDAGGIGVAGSPGRLWLCLVVWREPT